VWHVTKGDLCNLQSVADGCSTADQIQQDFGDKKRAQSPGSSILGCLQRRGRHVIKRPYSAAKGNTRTFRRGDNTMAISGVVIIRRRLWRAAKQPGV
jgi:hypothetical protein